MPYVRKLPSGLWQATVRLPDGSRDSFTDPLKGVVKEWGNATELAIRRGEVVGRRERILIPDWVDRWAAARVVRVGTRRRDNAGLRRIRTHWRGQLLGSIGRMEVQSWVQKMLADGVGPAATTHTYRLFASAMKAAMLENPPLIAATPCVRIGLPEQVPKLPPWFREGEVDAILKHLGEPHRTMTALMVWCGLRWGEAAGLRVQDVDFLRRRVRVVGALEDRVGWKEYPKSRKSRRELPVPQWVLDDMAKLVDPGRELVFVSRVAKTPHTPSNWRGVWRKALVVAKVSYQPPHTCRHTCASWLVQDGVPLYDVQAFMGHEDYVTTQRYAHLAPDAHDKVEESWARRSGGKRTGSAQGSS